MSPRIVNHRIMYDDTHILGMARSHCVTPNGFVNSVTATFEDTSQSGTPTDQKPAAQGRGVAVDWNALLKPEVGPAVLADAIESTWAPEHLDQVRWAAYLLRDGGSAWSPDQSRCSVGDLASRLQRCAKFLSIPDTGPMSDGAVIVACRLLLIDLWPMNPAYLWKVGIHHDFRFPGELPPRRGLAGSYEWKFPRRR